MCPSNKSKKQCLGDNLSVHIIEQAVLNQIQFLIKNKTDFLKRVELAVERNPKRVSLVEKLSQLQGELESLRQNQSQLSGEEDSFHQVVNREVEIKQTQLQIEIASIQTILYATYHPKQTKAKVQAIINQYQRDKDVDPLLKNLVESITFSSPLRLEIRLKVESKQVNPIYLQEITYPIRKKEKRFEHCIML